MELNEYQTCASRTAIYRESNKTHLSKIQYTTLGLIGEAGEIANKVKKISRDNAGVMTGEMARTIAMELGDVLWYVAMVADEIGYDLDHIASENLNKLEGRKEKGTLGGNGDNR